MHKIGIVGFGFMGTMHSNCYRSNRAAELAAAADFRKERRQQAEKSFGVRTYESLEEMLTKEELEVVDVCLPTYLHKDAAVAALKAGCHVICEKPMALAVQDCQEMIEAAQGSDRMLMVAHVLRFWPEYEVLKELVDSGELGALRLLSCQRLSPLPDWSWDNWLLDPKRSGGAAFDLHIHDTDVILHLLGKPLAVTSRGRHTDIGWGHIFTLYHYEGTEVFAEGGWDFEAPKFPFRMAFQAIFDCGAVEFNMLGSPSITIYEKGKEPRIPELPPPVAAADEAGGNIADLGGYYREIDYFLRRLDSGEKPQRVTPEGAREGVRVCLAEMESAATGKTVSL